MTKAKDPAFLFYPGDASEDTQFMNRLERGAYFDLVKAQRMFNHGFTTAQLRKILGSDFEAVWPSLEIILTQEGDLYFIDWLKKSFEKREEYSKKQSERSKKGWQSRGITTVIPQKEDGNENEIENENLKKGVVGEKNFETEPIDFKKEFDKFRRAYPGTKGGFEKEYKNFQKHKDWKSEILKLWLALEKEIDWRANRPPDKFTPEWKHLQTWINARCWEQEFESTANLTKSKSRIQDENIAKGLENFLHKQKLQDANLPKLEAGTVHA